MKTKTLTYGGLDWLVLSETDESVLVLSEQSIGNMPFDKDNNDDWKESSLRKYLNNDFLKQLAKNGADLSKIIPMRRDLTADDGLTDYGSCEDKVTLLTVEEYRNYRYSISNLDNWWWLATAYSRRQLCSARRCVRAADQSAQHLLQLFSPRGASS